MTNKELKELNEAITCLMLVWKLTAGQNTLVDDCLRKSIAALASKYLIEGDKTMTRKEAHLTRITEAHNTWLRAIERAYKESKQTDQDMGYRLVIVDDILSAHRRTKEWLHND